MRRLHIKADRRKVLSTFKKLPLGTRQPHDKTAYLVNQEVNLPHGSNPEQRCDTTTKEMVLNNRDKSAQKTPRKK